MPEESKSKENYRVAVNRLMAFNEKAANLGKTTVLRVEGYKPDYIPRWAIFEAQTSDADTSLRRVSDFMDAEGLYNYVEGLVNGLDFITN